MKKRLCMLALAVCVFGSSLPVNVYGTEKQNEPEIILLESPEEAVMAINGGGMSFFSMQEEDEEESETLNRIILRIDEKPVSTYGAEEIYYYTVGQEYILEYDTWADTEYAYERLVYTYGDAQVYLDEKVTLEATETESASSVSFDGLNAMGLDMLKEQAGQSWNEPLTVAVIDTGIDVDHPWFDERLSEDSVSFAKDSSLDDTHGHGTHVAGIIKEGTPDNVDIMAIRVFDENDSATLTTIRYAIDYAAQKGADVINLSLGDNLALNKDKNLMDASLSAAVESGAVVCAAAGNEYDDVANCYPASSYWTIAVGALKESDSGAYVYELYSNSGDQLDFTAPGTKILSAWNNGSTKIESGTSMATPHLSAAAAMIKLSHPDYNQWDVYAAFRDFAVDLGDTGKDDLYGYGYVNLSEYYDKETNGYDTQQYQGIQADAIVTKKINDEPFTLDAQITRGDGTLSISSANEAMASVNGDTVTIHKAGVCELILTASETEKYKETERRVQLVVQKLPQSIKLPQQQYTKKTTDGNFRVSAQLAEGDGAITYIGDNDNVVNVQADGLVTIVGTGTAKIYATASETDTYEKAASEAITVTVQKADPILNVSSRTVSVTADPFSLKVKRSGNGTLTYSSSNTKVATVSKSGKVTVRKVGTATITVKLASDEKYNAATKKVKITVNPQKTSIKKWTGKRRGVALYWKKRSGITGYQILYSTKSSMKNAKKVTVKGASKTNRTILGLKAKKVYYIQIRTYKKTSSKTYYSAWSKKQKIRTK